MIWRASASRFANIMIWLVGAIRAVIVMEESEAAAAAATWL
ncbi:hypothetical protein LPU83_pLPU83c_0518 (plasmid) [Rhizobium favelukesii]|uniref:Uncharacterized protein n=1 Tax=Rhizobium favelukesii TaxID=348824 RepID=W6RLF5_9HYPH|nr:hypothetical protein LPU83_pLPU83c_0518 [Rhizobium favelukesii]